MELATLGDLKLVEKPTPLTLAPHDFANIKASVKVTLLISAGFEILGAARRGASRRARRAAPAPENFKKFKRRAAPAPPKF